jgi:hypothetical protein
MFLKEIAERRLESHYDGPAVMIIDGCTAHDGDFFLDLCMERKIIPIPIPPHYNQVQILDITIFEGTERADHSPGQNGTRKRPINPYHQARLGVPLSGQPD